MSKVNKSSNKKNQPRKRLTKSINSEDHFLTVLGKGQLEMSKYFAKHLRASVKTLGRKICQWNGKAKLWEPIGLDKLNLRVAKLCSDRLDDLIVETPKNQSEKLAILYKTKAKYEKGDYVKGAVKYLVTELEDKAFFSELDKRPDAINFKNGVYELRRKKFRSRTRDDVFSQCLPYDWADPNPKIMKKIPVNLKQICNDSDEFFQFIMAWFGYCLTGETKEQMFMLLQGHMAQNGKTTILRMFMNAFPIYSLEVNQDFLDKSNTTRHKSIVNITPLIHLVFLEELERNALDVKFIKKFVDGTKMANKVMYGTEEQVEIYAKLVSTMNLDPKFRNDEGFMRRVLLSIFNNRFLRKSEFEKLKEEKGVYLCDKDLQLKFEHDEAYKLAFAHILIPFACQYYEKGLEIPEFIAEAGKELCGMNDPTKDFIDDHFKVTKNPADRIHNKTLLEAYKKYSGGASCDCQLFEQ